MDRITEHAAKRSLHFSDAINWFSLQLKTNHDFQKTFLLLSKSIAACHTDQKKSKKNVIFIAVGKSAQVGQLASSMLTSVGINSRFVHATEAFHGDLGVISKGDIVIAISNNGSSNEILQLLPNLKMRRVSLYAITSKPQSPLALASKHVMPLPPVSEMCPLNQAPITSTITTLALCQLLVASTMESRHFSTEQYAQNHPGGAIGKRIFLKVDDLMHKGTHLPKIKKTESFQNVVACFTRHAKAGLLVVENKKFLGLITEKDIRKAMQKHKKNVFHIKAHDLMNTKPTSVLPGVLAVDAMKLMTTHKPPFNVLPIVDKKGLAVGLLHIHDLISAGVSASNP